MWHAIFSAVLWSTPQRKFGCTVLTQLPSAFADMMLSGPAGAAPNVNVIAAGGGTVEDANADAPATSLSMVVVVVVMVVVVVDVGGDSVVVPAGARGVATGLVLCATLVVMTPPGVAGATAVLAVVSAAVLVVVVAATVVGS